MVLIEASAWKLEEVLNLGPNAEILLEKKSKIFLKEILKITFFYQLRVVTWSKCKQRSNKFSSKNFEAKEIDLSSIKWEICNKILKSFMQKKKRCKKWTIFRVGNFNNEIEFSLCQRKVHQIRVCGNCFGIFPVVFPDVQSSKVKLRSRDSLSAKTYL